MDSLPKSSVSPDQAYSENLYIHRDIASARWCLGGAFRFDRVLILMNDLYKSSFKTNSLVHEVCDSISCLWSSVPLGQESLNEWTKIKKQITWYDQKGIAVFIILNNIHLDEGDYEDALGHEICSYLSKPFWKQKHGVYIAHQGLAQYVKSKYPRLVLRCSSEIHDQQEIRTSDYYKNLLNIFHRVQIHPDDVFNDDLLLTLFPQESFEVTVNDRWKRQSLCRYEFLDVCSQLRKQPWNASLVAQKEKILKKEGWNQFSTQATCLLSLQRWQQLYEMGFRHFAVQSSQLRSEVSFVQHLIHWLIDRDPEIWNKRATIYSFILVGQDFRAQAKSPCSMMGYQYD